MKLSKLISLVDLADAIQEGYVTARRHPTVPLTIYNYTTKTQYERAWTDVTRLCRGLIVDDDNVIVARPWPKFFNYGEHEAEELDLDASCEVTDKLDGSLGILYPFHDSFAVATRGSFESDQARWATGHYAIMYADCWTPRRDYTYLLEIIYPENRVVLDYGRKQMLVLLGAVVTETGETISPCDLAWPGPKATIYPECTLREALEAAPRPNAEGLVVRYIDEGQMVKIKQDDYVRLHRIVFGLSARRLWEKLATNDLLNLGIEPKRIGQLLQLSPDEVQGVVDDGDQWLDVLTQSVPEEFRDWISETVEALRANAETWEHERRTEFAELGIDAEDRRSAAAVICTFDKATQGALFALLDGKTIRPNAWRSVRPAHEPPFARSEAIA